MLSTSKGGNSERAHPTVGHARSTRQMLTFSHAYINLLQTHSRWSDIKLLLGKVLAIA